MSRVVWSRAGDDDAGKVRTEMAAFLLWCILLVVCWPLALLVAVVIPLVWLVLLPLKLAGAVIGALLSLVIGLVTLPLRILCRF